MTLLLYDISRNDVIEQKTNILTPIYAIIQFNRYKDIANKCEVQKVMSGAGMGGDINSMIIKERQTYTI